MKLTSEDVNKARVSLLKTNPKLSRGVIPQEVGEDFLEKINKLLSNEKFSNRPRTAEIEVARMKLQQLKDNNDLVERSRLLRKLAIKHTSSQLKSGGLSRDDKGNPIKTETYTSSGIDELEAAVCQACKERPTQ